MKKEKINVIYIVGFGHSGSTLLDLILGSSKNCIGLGELKFLKNFVENKHPFLNIDFIDDTGKKATESEFWKPIIKELNEKNLYVSRLSTKEKLKYVLNILFGFSIDNKYDDKKLYSAILKKAKEKKPGVKYIIDSSKELRRLVYLNQEDKLNLYIIHLIREGRGVINSHEKQGYSWIKTFFHWITVNLFIKIYLRKHIKKDNLLTLSYDLFARNPNKHIRKLNEKFGLEIDEDNFIKKINKEPSYRFEGNWMRKKKLKEVKHDQKWKEELPKWKQLLLTILCYIPDKLWVYNED